MTMPLLPDGPVRCPSTPHRHDPMPAKPVGGRCAYFEPNRPGNICGRTPTALYVNPKAKVLNTYRCSDHDREVNRAEAERQGFRRLPVGAAS